MSFSEWDQCVQPKVKGTWNLHQATVSTALDIFLLVSSISAVVGQPSQANYNSANTFLDAFVNYRHGLGMPASAIDIGFMGCTGVMIRENKDIYQGLAAGGYLFLGEKELIDAVAIAIAYSRPNKDKFMNKSHLGIGMRSTKAMTDTSTRVVWKKDARFAISHHFGGLGINSDEEARRCLQAPHHMT